MTAILLAVTGRALSIPDAFPPEDDVACFAFTMAWARNDVRYSLDRVGRANSEDALEFTFWIRVANGFVYEAIHAVKAWRQHSPPVAAFLRGLPAGAREHLRQVSGVEQKVGNEALEHLRNRVFHYPHPEPGKIDAAVEELRREIAAQEKIKFTVDMFDEGAWRYTFADPVAMGAAWGRHHPIGDPRLEKQLTLVRDAGTAVSNLADDVFAAYVEAAGVTPNLRRGRG